MIKKLLVLLVITFLSIQSALYAKTIVQTDAKSRAYSTYYDGIQEARIIVRQNSDSSAIGITANTVHKTMIANFSKKIEYHGSGYVNFDKISLKINDLILDFMLGVNSYNFKNCRDDSCNYADYYNIAVGTFNKEQIHAMSDLFQKNNCNVISQKGFWATRHELQCQTPIQWTSAIYPHLDYSWGWLFSQNDISGLYDLVQLCIELEKEGYKYITK